MKKIFYLACIIIASALTSCEKPGSGNENTEDPASADFNFSVRVTEIGHNYAKINVRHDGPANVTWYGFIAENNKETALLITDKYMKFLEAGKVTGLRKSSNLTVTVDNLESEVSYKYIVFGITEDAKLYSAKSKDVVFKTIANPYVLTKTDEWKITRAAERLENNEVISIESTSSSYYYWDYVSKTWVESFNQQYPNGYEVTDLETGEIYATLDAFQYYIINGISTIQYWVAAGYNITDFTYVYDNSNAENNTYRMPRLGKGDYYFIAYGFNADGSHTQTYSISDLITIEEEESTPGYEAWLGSYEFSGKGYWIFEDDAELGMKTGDEKDVTYKISIEHWDNNFQYLIKGWECGEDALTDIETEFFDVQKENDEYIAFLGYYNDGKLQINEYNLWQGVDKQSGEISAVGMSGWAMTEKGDMEPVMLFENAEGPVAEAEPIAAGSETTTLNGLDLIYGGQKMSKYSMMGYIYYGYDQDGKMGILSIPNMPVQFPITIKKTGDLPESSQMMKQGIMKKAAPKNFKFGPRKDQKPVKHSRR